MIRWTGLCSVKQHRSVYMYWNLKQRFLSPLRWKALIYVPLHWLIGVKPLRSEWFCRTQLCHELGLVLCLNEAHNVERTGVLVFLELKCQSGWIKSHLIWFESQDHFIRLTFKTSREKATGLVHISTKAQYVKGTSMLTYECSKQHQHQFLLYYTVWMDSLGSRRCGLSFVTLWLSTRVKYCR